MLQANGQLKGKITVITGAARGLGERVCRTLAGAGARIIATDMRESMLSQLAEEIQAQGLDVTPVQMDVTVPAQVNATIDRIIEEHGRIDVLVNNAGTDVSVPVEDLTVDDWDKVVDVNLRGSFLTIRKVLPIMKKQKSGQIVNVLSTAGIRVWPCASVYHASKWGLVGFTHAIDKEARPHNVRVTGIISGGMRTPFITERFPDVPLDTLADPQVVADAIHFALMQPEGVFLPQLTIMPLKDPSYP